MVSALRSGFVIAAPRSGSGKTTVTLGLMAALQRRGMAVAPFKVGPDFIDPGHHRQVTGRHSINLDGWMCPEKFVLDTFTHHTAAADIAVVEGAMGLFDGLGGVSPAGSTGQIAALLDLPVILVVDARGQSRSVAALLQGFARFDAGVRVAGVIFNNVSSDSHAAILAAAVENGAPEVAVVGSMPRDPRLHLPSRHLGLVTTEDNPLDPATIDHLAAVVEEHLDLDRLLALAGQGANQRGQALTMDMTVPCQGLPPRIAVARDAAFCFVYEDNLRLLREAGAELVPFSPLEDEHLPPEIGGLYLPGGYPEMFAERLSANLAMMTELRQAVESDMPMYAECGGFMYLTRGICGDPHREDAPFVGIFPVGTRMLPKRKALGYREVEFGIDTPMGHRGSVARGHEFHYSEIGEMPAEIGRCYLLRREGIPLGAEGFRYRNCLGSYVHLHFGSNPHLAEAFVTNCRRFCRRNGQTR